jgi:hypothetical protein
MKSIITNKTLSLPEIANQATYFVSDFISLEGDKIRIKVDGWVNEQHFNSFPDRPIWSDEFHVDANQVPELNAQVVALRDQLIGQRIDALSN